MPANLQDLNGVKQEMGDKLNFHFNTALTTVSVMKVAHYLSLLKEERETFSMASLKVRYHNELLIQIFSKRMQ